MMHVRISGNMCREHIDSGKGETSKAGVQASPKLLEFTLGPLAEQDSIQHYFPSGAKTLKGLIPSLLST